MTENNNNPMLPDMPALPAPQNLTIYSTNNCMACRQTMRAFEKQHQSYLLAKLEDHPHEAAIFKQLGHMSAPVVHTPDGQIWSGFRLEKITEYCAGGRQQ